MKIALIIFYKNIINKIDILLKQNHLTKNFSALR
jgi:hypothetical protein